MELRMMETEREVLPFLDLSHILLRCVFREWSGKHAAVFIQQSITTAKV
jgi:hypothetical protein